MRGTSRLPLRKSRRLPIALLVVAGALLFGCDLGRTEAGSFSVAFTFEDGPPAIDTWVHARVEQHNEQGRIRIAEAASVPLQRAVTLGFPQVPHGVDYLVVIEIKPSADRQGRALYFGESQRFDLTAGEHRKVDVALGLVQTPTVPPKSEEGAVLVTDANELGYVRDAEVVLSLASLGATRVVVAHDFALEQGRREVSLASLPKSDARSLLGWNLDQGLCARPPCPDTDRRVYVQFANDQGYRSQTSFTQVKLDRVPPELVSASLSPSIAGVGARVTLVINPSEELTTAPRLTVHPEDPGFSAFERAPGGGYVASFAVPEEEAARRQLDFTIELTDQAGHTRVQPLAQQLVVDTRKPGLEWGAEVRPAVAAEGQRFTVAFELDEVVEQMPIVRVAGVVVACDWDGPSRRRFACAHIATAAEGGGERPIDIEARDPAGNTANLVAGSVLYDTLPRCGNGVVDAALLEACDLGADNSDAPDSSCRTDCQPRRCGDSIVDAAKGEVCDDGNVEPGDGCSADCGSDETCGNGIVDATVGEACDDGDLQSHDGCSSRCAVEQLFWDEEAEKARLWHPAYDPTRRSLLAWDDKGQVVRYWDGLRWSLLVAGPPGVLGIPSLAFDTERERIVLFGEMDSGDMDRVIKNDLFEWDGVTWQQRWFDPSRAPAPREQPPIVYDAGRKRVVMFGGSYGPLTFDRTDGVWEWDGERWHNLLPDEEDPFPPLKHETTWPVYDAARGRVVVYGPSQPEPDAEEYSVWEWDGRRWSRSPPSPGPLGQTLMYDPTRERLLLMGRDPNPNAHLFATWQWNGSIWEQVYSEHAPPDDAYGNLHAYDVARGRLYFQDQYLWQWDGTDWLSTLDERELFARASHAMVAEPVRGRLVMFGGAETSEVGWDEPADYFRDTLVYTSDGRWQRLETTTGPSERSHHAMAHNPHTGATVLFGGRGNPGYACGGNCAEGILLSDTWQLKDDQWQEVTPAETPSPSCESCAMLYDHARSQLVLFGSSAGEPVSVWVWDGAVWQLKQTGGPDAPGSRQGFAVAFDELRSRSVLFGGQDDSGTTLNDTWEWDGERWELRVTDMGPSSRRDHAMAYNRAWGRVVVHGGDNQGQELDDAWDWDGEVWRPVAAGTIRPVARSQHAMAFSPTAQRLVLFGGMTGGQSMAKSDTWSLRYESRSIEEICHEDRDVDGDGLMGCADPDCYAVCSPLCNPTITSCPPQSLLCGNGTCDAVESCFSCSRDCGECRALCGDQVCQASEDMDSCPGDCTP